MLLHQGLIVHSLMTKDWADRNGIKSFADIAAKKPQMRLHVNQLANLQSTVSMYVALFDAYGIKEEEVTKGAQHLPQQLRRRLRGAARRQDRRLHQRRLPADRRDRRRRARPAADVDCRRSGQDQGGRGPLDQRRRSPVPKGIYPFVAQDDITIALWNAVVAGAHVSGGDGLQVRQGDGARTRTGCAPSIRRSAEFASNKVCAQPDAASLSSGRRALLPRGSRRA